MALLFSGLEDWGLLVLRIFIGVIFLYHGWSKLLGGRKMAAGMGKPQMGGFLVFLGLSEFLGAIATVIGFLTQIASLGFAIIMIGAIFMKTIKWKTPFSAQDKSGWEFDFLILGVAITLILIGAGNISIDALLNFYP